MTMLLLTRADPAKAQGMVSRKGSELPAAAMASPDSLRVLLALLHHHCPGRAQPRELPPALRWRRQLLLSCRLCAA